MAIKTAKVVIISVVFAVSLCAGQAAAPSSVKFCDLGKSSATYNGRLVTITATLFPGDHSLLLYSQECESTPDLDLRTQAILPPRLESLPHGKKLESILNHGQSAQVEVVGVFESDAGRYGPDIAPFRFTITH